MISAIEAVRLGKMGVKRVALENEAATYLKLPLKD